LRKIWNHVLRLVEESFQPLETGSRADAVHEDNVEVPLEGR
jgi:hypothetical protein